MMRNHSIRFAPWVAGLLLLHIGAFARTLIVDNRHAAAGDENPGTREAPFLTINAAAQIAEAGDTVLVRPGLYREAVKIAHSGREDAPIVFQSEERHQAVVSGSDVLTDWQTDQPGVWYAVLPDMRRLRGDNNSEWAYLDRFPLLKAYERDELGPGLFFQDFENQRLYVALEADDTIDNHTIEYAWRQGLFHAVAWHHWQQRHIPEWQNHIHIRGFTVEHDGSWPRGMHAIRFLGRGWVIEDNHVRWVSSQAISGIGKDVVIRNNRIEWAGQLALGGGGANLLVENNQVFYSNWRPVYPWGEGGSSKYVTILDSIFRMNHCAYAYGSGIWFDGWASGNLVESNLVHDIHGAGLFTEIDLPGQIYERNISFNTGAGLNIAETCGVLARRNILFNNHIGIRVRGSYRRKWGDMHQSREPAEAATRRFRDFEKIGVSALRLRQLEADMFIYYFGPHALMSNNNAIWENLVFDNNSNYFEHRNYAEPSPNDPFINNFSNHNLWHAAEPEQYFSHGQGTYDSFAHWQAVSGRDQDSVILDPRTDTDRLPEWALDAEVFWSESHRSHKQLTDLNLRLTDGATAVIARARVRRSPTLEAVSFDDPDVVAYGMEVDGEPVLAIWLAHGKGARLDRQRRTHTLARRWVELRVDADTVTVENGYLGRREVRVEDGLLRLPATWVPVYVRGIGDFRAEP